jgi:uncharacterized protein YjbJ (UPF0337 family)
LFVDGRGIQPLENEVMDKDRVAGAANDAAGKVESAFGQATGNAARDAAGRAREASGTVQNIYGQAKDAARDLGENAGSYAQDALDAGQKVYQQGNRAVAGAVKDQPLGALLIAGAVGFTLAMLMRPAPRPRSFRDYYR